MVRPGHAQAWCSDLSSGHTRERPIMHIAERTPHGSIPTSGQRMTDASAYMHSIGQALVVHRGRGHALPSLWPDDKNMKRGHTFPN